MNSFSKFGASKIVFDNITFKSKLEVSAYKKLKESNLKFSYESERIPIWKGLKIDQNVELYAPKKLGLGKYAKEFSFYPEQTLRDITYTPDFIIELPKYKVYVDVKGKENDVYPLKRKMFLRYLYIKNNSKNQAELSSRKFIFFEPHSVKQVIDMINILKEYGTRKD